MADVTLATKKVQVYAEIKEIQSSVSVVDSVLFDDRTVHMTKRHFFTLAPDATTAINVTSPPSKESYPKFFFINCTNARLRFAFESTSAGTANPKLGVDLKAGGLALFSCDNASNNTIYIHNRNTVVTAIVTLLVQQVTWTI